MNRKNNLSLDTWRVFHIMAEFVDGFEAFAGVGKAISIFGSARVKAHDPYYQKAEKLARLLAEKGYAIITGGGPGIMAAVNQGAAEVGGKSVGLNIALPHEQEANPYQNIAMDFHYFFVRKVMFIKYAVGMICFPGGFGTLDEFFEAMTLLQTKKAPAMAVALVGSEYWNPLADWIRTTLLEQHAAICPSDLNLYQITDDPHIAVATVCDFFERRGVPCGVPPSAEQLRRHPQERLSGEGTIYGVPPWETSRRRTPPE